MRLLVSSKVFLGPVVQAILRFLVNYTNFDLMLSPGSDLSLIVQLDVRCSQGFPSNL